MSIKSICAVLAALFINQVHAFNHPEIQWKTVSTEHFTINYYDKTEPAVYATWKIAEEAFAAIAPLYNYAQSEKMTISIAEYDDYSNGFAEWLSGSILIWLPDAQFDLRSNTTWLRNVITHEMAHIISLDQKKSMQLIDVNLSCKISTPSEEYGISNPIPRVSELPTWLVEGIAQFETEQKSNDAFDSRREMVLRSAVLSNTMLSLDEMGNFNHDKIGNELVYNQGFAFTRYLAGQIGVKNLRGIVTDGSYRKINFLNEFYTATGLHLEKVYTTWMDSLRAAYASRFSSVESNHTTVAGSGITNQLPKYAPNGSTFGYFSSGIDDGSRTDLCIADSKTLRVVKRINYAHTSFCFSANSEQVFYIQSRNPDNVGSYFNDLYSCNLLTGARKRITHKARIYEVCAIPGSTRLLCVLYTQAGYGLFTCSPENGTFVPLIAPEAGNPILHCSVNPQNSDNLLYSKLVNGQSHLFTTSISAPSSPVQISSGNAQEESPFYAKNGRIYYSADYDGVFNIYSIAADGSDVRKHTETDGGYFSPQLTPEGKIIASLYRGRSFSIVTTDPLSLTIASESAPRPSFQPLPVANGTVSIKSRPYVPLLRRSYWEITTGAEVTSNNILLPRVATDESDNLFLHAYAQRYRSDALHKSQQVLSFGLGTVSRLGNSSTTALENQTPLQIQTRSKLQSDSLTHHALFHPQASPQPSSQISTHFRHTAHYLLRQPSYAATSDYQEPPAISLLPRSAFAFESNALSPTLGFSSAVQMNLGEGLLHIALQPYFSQQIGREWSWGGSVEMQSIPLYGITQFLTPFFLEWTHTGYINEDFSYNYGGATHVEVGGSYCALPSLISTSPVDSTLIKAEGWEVHLSVLHAIPLLKYSSLAFSSFTDARFYNRPILDFSFFNNGYPTEVLDEESDLYLFSSNSVKLTFPLNRTINQGSRYYADALYGAISYSFVGYTNNTFLGNTTITQKALTDPDYMPGSLYIDHRLTYECNLGIHKSYLFFGLTHFSISQSLIRKSTSVSLTAGF